MALEDGLSLLFKIRADGDQAKRELGSVRQTVSKELKDIDSASASTTKSVGGLGGAFSSVISPANLMAGAGIAAAGALLVVGKQALDAAGELFDLHQKTNFSVESLSALKIAGETSGVSIQSLSGALGIFQKNMVAAEGGNKKLTATFKDLNISTKDHETALRDAFRALSAMEEGEEQTAAAMQLFGRSGRDVLAVMKEMGGDLDGAISKFREMGVLIDHETAVAADNLGDSLTGLGQSAKALANDLLKTLGPALRVIASIIGTIIQGARDLIKLLDQITDPGRVFPIVGEAQRLDAINKGTWGDEQGGWGEESTSRRGLGGMITAWGRGARRTGGGGGGRGGGGGGRAARAGRTPDEFGEDLVDNLKSQVTLLMASKDAAGKAEAAIKNLEREHGALSETVKNSIREGYRLIEVQEHTSKNLEIQKKAMDALRETINKQSEAVIALSGGWETNSEQLEEHLSAMTRLNIIVPPATANLARLNALLLDFVEMRKRMGELPEDVDARFGGLGGLAGTEGTALGAQILQDAGLGEPPPPPDFSGHISAIGAFKDAALSAWGSIGAGFANMIQAFLMGEKFSGKAFMAMAKSAIAAVAAEAGVRALFELAMGLASLWLNPAKAASHFAAAKVFGLVAGAAAIASLAIPGGGKPDTAASTTTAGTSTVSKPSGTSTITQERSREQVIRLVVESNDSHVIKVVGDNLRFGGDLKVIVDNGGVLASA